ncbi:MAG: DUF1624 domain-containing protein [Lachnospiraceae bacterium]|nr:DUF1624 domain-containing protein [Lachnospiraceae bacterium]
MSETRSRLGLIDTIRGITIISMILFHACWDILYFDLGLSPEFLYGTGAYIWQQSICWSFIFISGFCFSYGHDHLKQGLKLIILSLLVTAVTVLVMPDERIVFGVLTLLGCSVLLTIPLDRLFSDKKGTSIPGLLISLLLFFLLRNINRGTLGFEKLSLGALPENLYKGYFMTFLGFMDHEFISSDYFSVIPWVFMFLAGYFTNRVFNGKEKDIKLFKLNIRPLAFLGRHSLIIYLAHQVILYLFFLLLKHHI